MQEKKNQDPLLKLLEKFWFDISACLPAAKQSFRMKTFHFVQRLVLSVRLFVCTFVLSVRLFICSFSSFVRSFSAWFVHFVQFVPPSSISAKLLQSPFFDDATFVRETFVRLMFVRETFVRPMFVQHSICRTVICLIGLSSIKVCPTNICPKCFQSNIYICPACDLSKVIFSK